MNLTAYQNLNDSFSKRLVFHFGSEAGFFSEFNNLVLAMAYCLKNKIKFELYSKDAKFSQKNGWTDYFLPFCQETSVPFHKYFNRRRNYGSNPLGRFINPLFNAFSKTFKLLYNIDFLTFDIFEKCRDRKNEEEIFNFQELDFKGNLRELCKEIIEMIWRLNDNTQNEINSMADKLKIDGKYIGIHIRVGDKIVETKHTDLNSYMNKAEKITDIRNAFIATDDYRRFEELKQNYPDWNFFTLTTKEQQGYNQQEFVKSSSEARRNNIINLLASIKIISNGQYFFGTFSSNIGMFLGMSLSPSKVIGIDFTDWRIW